MNVEADPSHSLLGSFSRYSLNRLTAPETGIVHHCTAEAFVWTRPGHSAWPVVFVSVITIVCPPDAFTYGSVTPWAQWMSLRIRSSARRAFSWASNRRIWSTWAVWAEMNECAIGARTASITTM